MGWWVGGLVGWWVGGLVGWWVGGFGWVQPYPIFFWMFGIFSNFAKPLNKNMTEMIQQSAMTEHSKTNQETEKPKMSSPTRALMKKRTEMIENNTPRDHIEYVEICKTIKKKAREDIRKHNLDEIRETIEASKSLKRVTHNLGKNRMITLPDKHGKQIQEQDKIMERIEEFYSELYVSD